uniref:Uncharacterized protein n=1 Tax=Cacopsylla melanoneura TaxID=428564 RepID=A0A8D9AH42_9HEMI
MFALFGHISHGSHRCSIQIIIVLASFYEQMILNIFLHLFSGGDKVVIPCVNFVFSPSTRCVWYTRAELFRELGYKIIIDTIFQRTQYDNRPGIVYLHLSNGFIG